jgi:YYY domain-containing protein
VNRPPSLPFQWRPNRSGGWWWWQASRVVQDFKANDVRELVIDEFPHFSYILADLHPHVLTMPVVLLALTVILNIFMGLLPKADEKLGIIAGLEGVLKKDFGWALLWDRLFVAQWLRQPIFWLLALILGGIAFFNTWDFPIYLGLFSLGVPVFNTIANGWSKNRVTEFVETFLLTAILSVLLYLPYFLGFGSQAGGFLPSVIFYTRGIYFWIMFVSLLVPILLWLFQTAKKKDIGFHGQFGVISAVSIVGGLWLFSYTFAVILLFIAPLLPSQRLQTNSNLFFWLQGGVEGGALLLESLTRRFTDPLTWVTLGVMLLLVAGLIFARKKGKQKGLDNPKKSYFWQVDEADHKATAFLLLLVLLGVGLTLVPEYIYLLDQFGTRMNTIFKFYFQTWIVWGIAAAYATVIILRESRGVAGLFAKTFIVVTVLIGLIYPYFAIKDVTNNFQPRTYSQDGELQPDWSLDGALYLKRSLPDEMAAIAWLSEAPLGTVAEAVGGSYTNFARVSTYSGQPTVLGWPGHESQWRGGAAEMGTRESDIEQLYRSGQWDTVRTILDQYGIRYVFLGDLEYSKYNASTKVFDAYLTPLFVSGNVIIYGYDAVP